MRTWRRRLIGDLLLAAAVGLTAYVSLVLTAESGQVAALWPANAVVLAVVLRTRPQHRLDALASGALGCLAAGLITGDHPAFSIGVSLVNQVEVALAATIALSVARAPRLALHKARHLMAFGLAAIAAPLVSGLLAMNLFPAASWTARLGSLQHWWLADALGLIVVTPLLLALTRKGLAEARARLAAGRGVDAILILAAATAITFGQSSVPMSVLLFAALTFCAFRLPVAGVAIALLATAVVALGATLSNVGVISLIAADMAFKLTAAQIYLAISSVVTLSIAVLMAEHRRTLRRLELNEARYREMADKVSDLIVRVRDDRILYVSPSVRRLGYEPVDVVGRPISDFIHPDDLAASRARAQASVEGHLDPSVARIQRIRTAAGDWVWLEGNPQPIRDADGQFREMLNVFRDVTHRRQLEEELTRARDAAEDAARVKADFLANMSHEIRTPLTAIIGFTGRLEQRDDLQPAARTSVERIAGAGRALLSIVNDVLDFSKLEAGLMPIRPQAVDPAACLADAVALLDGQADAKGLDLQLETASLPPSVRLDPDRLRQILLNLIGNAIKFTPEGRVVVSAAYDESQERLRVDIRDTGPGLSAEQASRLFVRFSQVDASSTRAQSGTGLGLAICRGLADAMGGDIGVTSTLGDGATFWFEVAAPLCAPAPAATITSLDGLRLLVADDHPVNRELIRALLEPLGVEVTDAEDGEEAVRVAAQTPVDVILMDLRMPGCDGVEAARRIRTSSGLNNTIPILAFSAEGDVPPEGRGLFDGLVAKPIDQGVLLEQLIACIGQAAAALADSSAA